jgi:PIN domain nuclease of toxin-antitoxin system
MLGAIRQTAGSGSLLVSAISVWELGMFEAKGRIRLKPSCEEWVREALATPGLALAPITPEIALESSRLPGPFHGDPADRIIVATARKMGAQLMTRDRKLIQYGRKGHLAIL